jgi:hypothetical protein
LNPQSLTAEDSLAYLPGELWWDMIALVIQCFPGATQDSFTADLGDAPPLALHSVFDPAIAALERLSIRTRSLLFVDWKYNSEIAAVVQAALQRNVADQSHASGT